MLLLQFCLFWGAMASLQGFGTSGTQASIGHREEPLPTSRRPLWSRYLRRMDHPEHDKDASPSNNAAKNFGARVLGLHPTALHGRVHHLEAQAGARPAYQKTKRLTKPSTQRQIAHPSKQVESEYFIIRAKGDTAGPGLIGSGMVAWTTLEACISMAESSGYIPADTLKYVQGSDGRCNYYGPGSSSGEMTVEESYRLDSAEPTTVSSTSQPTLSPTIATPTPTVPSTDPNCDTGIQEYSVCCSGSCGSCGGAECSLRPGGADNCCTNTIDQAAKSCNEYMPPCVVNSALSNPTGVPTVATPNPTRAPTVATPAPI